MELPEINCILKRLEILFASKDSKIKIQAPYGGVYQMKYVPRRYQNPFSVSWYNFIF